MNPARICVSPGPCSPAEAGISIALIQHFAGKLPILGVCLGHQAIGAAFGGDIVRAKQIMHGKVSSITHTGTDVFAGRSEEHTSELQSLMRISYAVFCLKKKTNKNLHKASHTTHDPADHNDLPSSTHISQHQLVKLYYNTI